MIIAQLKRMLQLVQEEKISCEFCEICEHKNKCSMTTMGREPYRGSLISFCSNWEEKCLKN